MQDDAQSALERHGYRYSLATLLLIFTAIAALLGAWKIWSYEPPTNRISSYEKAEGTRKSWFDVGPNRVQLAMIARNDRDGTLHAEDGNHHTLTKPPMSDAGTIARAGSWLDVAEIRLAPGPESVDLIDARIFDTKTMTLISEIDPAYGWRITERNVLQLYGLGKPLPERLDVWLRLNSYAADSPVAKLAPVAGTSCILANATFTLEEVRDGRWNFSGNKFVGTATQQDGAISLILSSQETNEPGEHFQIVAVSKSGGLYYTNMIHFLRPQPSVLAEPIYFDLALNELDHFEIRTFGGRHRFFFEGVQLPKISQGVFTPPPKVNVAIEGHEIEKELKEFAPLEFKLATFRGTEFGGSYFNEAGGGIIRSIQSRGDADRVLTVAKWTRGLSPQLWNFRYVDVRTHAIMLQGRNRAFGGNGRGGAAYETFDSPLEQLGDLEVSLNPPASSPPAKVSPAKSP